MLTYFFFNNRVCSFKVKFWYLYIYNNIKTWSWILYCYLACGQYFQTYVISRWNKVILLIFIHIISSSEQSKSWLKKNSKLITSKANVSKSMWLYLYNSRIKCLHTNRCTAMLVQQCYFFGFCLCLVSFCKINEVTL